jgi:hypothetical protein
MQSNGHQPTPNGSRKRRTTSWHEKRVVAAAPQPEQSDRALPGSDGNQNADGSEAPSSVSVDVDHQPARALSQAPWLLALVTLLLAFACIRLCTLQFQPSVSNESRVSMPTDFTGMQFLSCDQKTAVKFRSQGECAVYKSGHRANVKYTLVKGDNFDLFSLCRGYLSRSEIWYRWNDEGIVGRDNIVLYRPDAPELAVVKKMWWYASFAQQYYKEGRLYPSDAEKCKQSDPNFTYVNPITGASDYAAIVLQKNADGEAKFASRAGNSRHWRPGAIFCLCSDYKKFLIQGFDRQGRQLTSSDPTRYFTIDCENGIDLTKSEQLRAQSLPEIVEDNTAARVLVYESPDVEATVQWTRSFIQIVLWTMLFIAGFSCYAVHKSQYSSQARVVSIISIALSLFFLGAWYIVAFHA